MGDVAARRERITAARAGFLATGSAHESAVPEVVAASWERSRSAGVDASTSEASFHSDLDVTSRLVRCSLPIIARLSEETANIPLSIAMTDSKARLLTRVDNSLTIGRLLDNVSFAPGFDYAEGGMGTNGVGTVFESGQPIQIVGPEHFHERLQPFACSGTPIRDPLSGRIEGVLDISCLVEHSSPLMHSLVRSAAHEIERSLMLYRSLIVGIAEAHPDEAHIEAGALEEDSRPKTPSLGDGARSRSFAAVQSRCNPRSMGRFSTR
jgi:transcriptional regulator of acetoin/glycerol metabolism